MKTSFSYRVCQKGISWLLAFVMLWSLCFECAYHVLSVESSPAAASFDGEAPYIVLDEERVDEITLQDDAKLRLEAVSQASPSSYRWQIRHPDDKDRWIPIADGQTAYLWLTYALVGSMLDANGIARLRCALRFGEEEVTTDPITVRLSLGVPSFEEPAPTPAVVPATDKRVLKSVRAAADQNTTQTIVINYLFDNNTIAFEPYGASIATGSDFKATIKSPEIVGYTPFRRIGDDYVDASVVEIDLKNVQENVTINVIYEPALVEYTVHHHLQNILDDEYSVHYDLVTKGKALTGTVVGDGLALTEDQLPGFKPLAYEKLTVAADGSTVIEIRYDRNYYLIDFNMDGGYGSEPVYTRYGATVGTNDPIRHGYVFDGWELVSYGGQTPTTEQQAIYALQTGRTIEVPAANLSYKANWITQQTTYTMVFWRENANDSGYSYWGYLDNLAAMSGSTVDGRDLIGQVANIDDEQYFTFNGAKTDKNVLVEGDGSTVVNVYYTRNYYTLTFKAPGKCTITPNHTHNDSCYELICGLGHAHTEECVPLLSCLKTEHTAHTPECIACGYEEHVHGSAECPCTITEHTHTANCWESVGSVETSLNSAPRNPQEGQIYRSGKKYYIYILGLWYRYNGRGVSSGDIVDPSCDLTNHTHGTDCACDKKAHTHSDNCYGDDLHTHDKSCYTYSCGLEPHTHTTACSRLLCAIPEKHTHTAACNSDRENSTVKTVYAKYGQSLKHIWPVTDDNGKTYDSGERWSPSSSSYYNAVLVYIAQMPPDDFTLTLNTASYKDFTMNYYLQVLPGEESYDKTYGGKNYKLDNVIKANYNYITKAEDFFDIAGFVQYESDPAFDRNGQISDKLTVNFYYNRADYNLEFNNSGTVMDDRTVDGIMYEMPLGVYHFEPPYPENLEPNAYAFAGWYTSPGCFKGTEVNWDTITMPEGDLMLYAKWAPVTHTVRVFKDATMTEQIGSSQTVDHKSFAAVPDGTIANGNYVFQGWFYQDVVNGVTVEKAFAFNGIPIVKDMDIYAKWSSHVSVNYKVSYKIYNTDIEIADPTVGSAIAGHNKTFDAKAGDQLYAAYRIGYYPMTNSHTITMSVDGNHEFTFYYVFVESMPYKVQYVNSLTGQKLCEDKVVKDNTLSVVTETFKRFDNKMPDAYQKRLVLAADSTDADQDGIYDANVITFYYHDDEEHAYYRVVHYIENISGDSYREYRSEEATGLIGSSYTVNALTLTGFLNNPAKTTVNGVSAPTTGMSVTTTLTAEGALIELYYDRQSYEYAVHYVDSRTGEDLHPTKTGSGVFGEQIVEYAVSLDGIGYELVSDSAKTHTISASEEHNWIEFLYQEKNVAIKYQVVGPQGCGALSQYSENLTAITGVVNGSTPIVNNGFVFLGWFTDENCTVAAPTEWVDSETNRLVPQKTGEVWTAVTYYAKYTALETDLTITTRSTSSFDAPQTFLFRIRGKKGTETEGIDLVVTIVGNGSTTVTKLPTGDYTVIEMTDWSWRYEQGNAEREIKLEYNDGSTELVFDNSRENGKWLDGNAVKDNRF